MADAYQQRVRSIFQAAVEEHAPERWEEYLGAACQGEPELRQRVEVLLHGHKKRNEILDDPGAAPVPNLPASIGEGPGTLVGAYKLLEQIGEGGFGVVFMAEQQHPVRRKVALKIVKPGMDTRQVVVRFEAERQALALMDHPNIAQIFDGGATESGRPYFAMELVRGVPITEYCDQNQLGLRERLELFTHVCRAVQHAHQKGIIHRDLKPSNVMVTNHDVTPVVKIIDFGIAKATGQQLTDKTLFTNFAKMIGTPMYMSPEQAQLNGLDVDTRSDVYSLGVLLYELMTGRTPFDKERLRSAAYDEVIRIIREEEPVRPSTRISTLGPAAKTVPMDRTSTPRNLSRLLQGELDWIVMKSLEKDRNRRYESAGALGQDVQRYLNDEPVLACPPTVGYRLRKTAQRHKAVLATAAMVFVALAAGMAVAVWQAVAATEARRDALAAAVAETEARAVAEAKEAEALAVVRFLERRILAAAGPEGVGPGLGHDVSLRKAVEAAVPFVREGFKDQPLIEARLRRTLGSSFASLQDGRRSGEQFAIARDIYAARLGPNHEKTLDAATSLAWSHTVDGRFAEARRLAEETFQQARLYLGREHEVTLRVMDHLASAHDGLDAYPDALRIRNEALAIRTATLGPDHDDTIQSRQDVAVSYTHLERYDEALALEEKVLAIRRAKLGPDNLLTLEIHNNVAVTLERLGRLQEACQANEDVLARRRKKLPPDHPHILQSQRNLANCLGRLGRYHEALELHEKNLEEYKARYGPKHDKTLECMRLVAACHQLCGQFEEAARLCGEAFRLVRERHGPDHRETLHCMQLLAMIYKNLGRHEQAFELGKETLTRRIAVLGPDNTATLQSMNNLAVFLSDLDRLEEALALHQKTLAARTAKLGAAHPDTLMSLANVARCLGGLDRDDEALPVIDDCIRRAAKADGGESTVADMMYLRMRHFYNADDMAGCRETAAMWDTLKPTAAGSFYGAARARARVAAVILEQDTSAEAQKESNQEADRAMDWLHKAVAAGYKNSAHMAKDAGLDILRQRPDFIKLMAEFTARPKADKE